MAGSIKIFQFIQNFHGVIGISPAQSFEQQRSINSRNAIFLVSCAQEMFAIVAFLIFEAQTMFDYGFGFFGGMSLLLSIVVYVIFIRQSENTFKFIENCEAFIEKSKQHSCINHIFTKVQRSQRSIKFM